MKEKWIVEFYLVCKNDNHLNVRGETSTRYLIYDFVVGDHYFESESQAKEVLERLISEEGSSGRGLPRVFEIRKIYML